MSLPELFNLACPLFFAFSLFEGCDDELGTQAVVGSAAIFLMFGVMLE